MGLVAVERIKLFSTRSPYWCLVAIAVSSLSFSLLFALIENGRTADPFLVTRGVSLAGNIFMVLAALAVTTEYRFGTIRNTFLAAPNRTAVLAAKTLLLAVIGGVVGLVASLAAFYLAVLLAPNPPPTLKLDTADDWRQIAGYGLLFLIGAVIAVSVGTLIRQSAGAIAILLLWPLILESLFTLIPTVGPKVGPWLPFAAGNEWVAPRTGISQVFSPNPDAPTPVQGLLVFAATAAVLWVIALVVLKRRDA